MINLKEVALLLAILLTGLNEISCQDPVTITEYENENTGNGDYIFRFVQSDGTEREESGGFEGEGNYVVRGYYSYIDNTGKKQKVRYYADKTGYHVLKDVTIEFPPSQIVPVSGVLPPDVAASLLG